MRLDVIASFDGIFDENLVESIGIGSPMPWIGNIRDDGDL
jgi:hypothetical protein